MRDMKSMKSDKMICNVSGGTAKEEVCSVAVGRTARILLIVLVYMLVLVGCSGDREDNGYAPDLNSMDIDGQISGIDGQISGIDGQISGTDGQISGTDRQISGSDGQASGSDRQTGGSAAITMLPSTAGVTGMYAGYLFVPIDGQTYRYAMYNGDRSELIGQTKRGRLLIECVEDTGFDDKYNWTVYSLEEYPDFEMIVGVCRNAGDDLFTTTQVFKYDPAKAVEEQKITDAVADGFVMMENGSVVHGKQIWQDFLKKTQAGEKASVCLAESYRADDQNVSSELYIATLEDYPSLFLSRLTFDGSLYNIEPLHKVDGEYIVQCVEGYDSPASSWKYLMHYYGESEYSFSLFSYYDRYVLTNDDTVTWKQLEWGVLSSQMGDYIPYEVVYNEYTYR